jgi:hypothetical protein
MQTQVVCLIVAAAEPAGWRRFAPSNCHDRLPDARFETAAKSCWVEAKHEHDLDALVGAIQVARG